MYGPSIGGQLNRGCGYRWVQIKILEPGGCAQKVAGEENQQHEQHDWELSRKGHARQAILIEGKSRHTRGN